MPSQMPMIAKVAVARPLRRLFDYLIPENLSVQPGQGVKIPFGHQTLSGIVISVHHAAEARSQSRLKSIERVMEGSTLPQELINSLQWAARYYQHPIGDTLVQALPPQLRHADTPRQRPRHRHYTHHPTNQPAQKLGHRQRALLDWLRESDPISTQDIRAAGFSKSQLDSLVTQQLIIETDAATPPSVPERVAIRLSPAQHQAYAEIPQPGHFSVSLLYGITGSGKTELYLHYLAQLPSDTQAMVLVPEINLTPQTLSRFQRHFGARVKTWHSNLNDTERADIWQSLRSGVPLMIVGTRSAALLPFTQLGAIIIDEEHDSSYKQQDGFRYSARDFAIYRARQLNCPVVLGSATPSLESWHNALQGRYRMIQLLERANRATPPRLELIDVRSRPLQDGLSHPMLQAIDRHLAESGQVLVFVNRRGYAPVIMCFSCGHIMECPRCDSRLTWHRAHHRLLCHHCNYQVPLPKLCPSCHEADLNPLGQGTERAEQALAERFPTIPILRVDRDTTRQRGAMHTLAERVRQGQPCVLVGTQMLAKGHDFPNITLVCVLDADNGLFSADYRAPEVLLQTLLQVAGRAGRAERAGQVLVQTRQGNHPLLQLLCHGDYAAIANHLLEERQQVSLPPSVHMATLRAESPSESATRDYLANIRSTWITRAAASHTQLLGPVAALMQRKAGFHRFNLYLHSSSRPHLQRLLSEICDHLDSHRPPPRLRWSVDVDPLGMD